MSHVQAARVSAFDEQADEFPDDGAADAAASAAGRQAVLVQTMFRGVGVGAKILPFPDERRRHRAGFRIGAVAGVDAPVDPRFVGATDHALVTAAADGWVVHATPQMCGALATGGGLRSLAELSRDGTSSFRLPPGGRASLVCGATTFLLSAVPHPGRLPRALVRWRRDEVSYGAATAVAFALALLVIFAVPPDPRALSLDFVEPESHLVTFRIAPPAATPAVASGHEMTPPVRSGAAGAPAAGPRGAMGSTTSTARDRAFATKGPRDNLDPRAARADAEARAREAGVLGVLRKLDGPVAQVFDRTPALGDASADALGNVVGAELGDAAGWGGLSTVGTGRRGAGIGEGILGMGGLNTIGAGGALDGPGRGRARLAGALTGRRSGVVPDLLEGHASVRGALDKEIIRRVVRRHLNEVKFCYEQELVRQPSLAGRVVVQFMIAGTGQVISSVVQSSTLSNPRVEGCVVQAVRRWPFPAPDGGGMVTVSYPFVLTPAG